MINRQRTNWWKMLFIWRGSVLRKVTRQLLLIFAVSVLVLLFKGRIYEYKVPLNPTIFTLIGLALAIFMGFCNTASYDRYWEGRKLWGALIIEARSLTREILTIIPEGRTTLAEKQYFVKLIAAFTWALNGQLRGQDQSEKLAGFLHPEDLAAVSARVYRPVAILDLMSAWISERHRRGEVDSILLAQFSERLNQLSAIVGGCERIATSPLPFAYSLLLHRTVYCYCLMLPFGLVDSLHWMMPFVVLLITYSFIALDALVQEIEEPFGNAENDLPLNAMSRNITFSIFEQAAIPQPPLPPNDHYFVD